MDNFAFLLKTDGTKEAVAPKNSKDFSYEELRGFVNGYFDVLVLPRPHNGLTLVVNDEGILDGLPPNEEASRYWNECYPIDKFPYNNLGYLVGNILVCKSEMVQ